MTFLLSKRFITECSTQTCTCESAFPLMYFDLRLCFAVGELSIAPLVTAACLPDVMQRPSYSNNSLHLWLCVSRVCQDESQADVCASKGKLYSFHLSQKIFSYPPKKPFFTRCDHFAFQHFHLSITSPDTLEESQAAIFKHKVSIIIIVTLIMFENNSCFMLPSLHQNCNSNIYFS